MGWWEMASQSMAWRGFGSLHVGLWLGDLSGLDLRGMEKGWWDLFGGEGVLFVIIGGVEGWAEWW